MKKKIVNLLLLSILFLFLPGTLRLLNAQSEFTDTPYFSGMPNFRISDASDQEFADYKFFNGKNCTTVEGEKYFRDYTFNGGAKQPSDLQVSRNYSNAIKNMGGTVIFEGICEGGDCADNCGYQMMVGKVVKADSELWLEVVPFNDGNDYYLTIVVKQAMKQDVTANDMLDALNSQGFIALYINFDSGKSTIKSESQPIITQIVELLNSNPELKLSIEGHTDSKGTQQSNQVLSENRAKAVMTELINRDINAERLAAVGFGQDKPIADNNTEEGRAKNRRVELVKK